MRPPTFMEDTSRPFIWLWMRRRMAWRACRSLQHSSTMYSLPRAKTSRRPCSSRMLAMSRIYLDNVPHIKAYWVMYGKATTELALAFGADDIDGTIDDTTKIYSMAGADDRRPSMSVEEMRRIVRAAGCRAVERDTFYNELPDR